ncbi:hypothetical protein IFM89_018653 [Coptis chinensis]|uniref:DNA-directed RNA polymerase subunit n=1 Tax=Coptis chinensis TaxID=261450 RepID=A0A835LRV3_9MAGN|nr:hypothetical protein IFM89_018653 [Coptis chinensis]
MFSGDEMRKAAECQVFSSALYDEFRKPKNNGLLDSRMGPANKTGTCSTCHGNFTSCPGHFGYLSLSLPVYNVGYFASIINILKCICKSCARILLTEKERRDYLKKMRNPRMEALQKNGLAKQVLKKCKPACSRCGYVNGMVKKKENSVLRIIHYWKAANTGEEFLDPVRVLALFKKMLDEDCEVLYLSDRPEKLIITDIPVPPIPIRPSVIMDGGQNSNENDVTSKLRTIIQANASLRNDLQCTGSTSKCLSLHGILELEVCFGWIATIENVFAYQYMSDDREVVQNAYVVLNSVQTQADWELLQIEVAQYINSDVRGVPASMQPSRPLQGFVQRLKGKQGRFRGNLSGKRVEYTGRTVISPDPNLKITEVAIPILMAQILTYPERVSHHNLEKLRQCVRNGPQKYPGANFIRYPDGTLIEISVLSLQAFKISARKRAADELKYGHIVEHHLEDGDIVLFNRQPSLHRMSIMSHRARVMPWRTLRFNESVCNPYNADFDGDEMNMHVPQTEEARTEALTLMGITSKLVSHRFFLGLERKKKKNLGFLNASSVRRQLVREGFCQIVGYCVKTICFVEASTIFKHLHKGAKQPVHTKKWRSLGCFHSRLYITSSFLITRKDTFYDRAAFSLMCSYMGDAMDPVDLPTPALIKLLFFLGSLTFLHYGNGFHCNVLLLESQPVELWTGKQLFSILARPHAQMKVFLNLTVLEKNYSKSRETMCPNDGFVYFHMSDRDVVQYGNGNKDGLFSVLLRDYNVHAAASCMNRLAKLSLIFILCSQVCMKELHWRNSPLIMSQCGSKGSPINISQMIACVGQQSVGRRAPNGFIDRSLPHFPRKCKTPSVSAYIYFLLHKELKNALLSDFTLC